MQLVKSMPDLEVPSSIVRDEARHMAAQALSSREQSRMKVIEAFMEMAEGRVRGGLLMGELAQQNGISIDGLKVREAIQTIASTYEQPAESCKCITVTSNSFSRWKMPCWKSKWLTGCWKTLK